MSDEFQIAEQCEAIRDLLGEIQDASDIGDMPRVIVAVGEAASELTEISQRAQGVPR